MHRIFEIYELLQLVVSFFDISTAVNAARVSSIWYPLVAALIWERVDGAIFTVLGDYSLRGRELALTVRHPH